MKQITIIATFVSILLLTAYVVITLYDNILPYGRMWESAAVKPHEKPILDMEEGTIPFRGGEALLKSPGKKGLKIPADLSSPDVHKNGRQVYGFFCIQCHGKNLDGLGTVGQSFHPLPRVLYSDSVLKISNTKLFNIISYGEKRMPGLSTTMKINDRWAVIGYMRSYRK